MGELLELPSELLTRVLELLGARDAWRARGTSRAVRAAVDGIAWNELEVHYNIPGDPDGLYKFVWIMDSTTRLVAGGKLRLAPSATVGLVGNLTVTDDGRESVQLASSARRLLHAWSAACPAPGLRKVRAGLALRLLGHAARSPGPAAMLHSVTVSVLDGLFPAADREERTTALSSLKLDVVFPDAGPHGWAVSASDGAVLRALLAPHEALRSLRLPGAAVLDRRALEFLAAACPRLRRLRCSLAERPPSPAPPACPSTSSSSAPARAPRRRPRRPRRRPRRPLLREFAPCALFGRDAAAGAAADLPGAARPDPPVLGPALRALAALPSLEHIHGWLHLGHLTGIGEGDFRAMAAGFPRLRSLALRLYSDDQVLWLTAALRECRWPLERLDLCLHGVQLERWAPPPQFGAAALCGLAAAAAARFPFSFSLYSQRPLEPPLLAALAALAPRLVAAQITAAPPADAAAAAGPRAALEALASESRPVRIRLFEPPRV
eukprot:tig00001066_g6757.t1